MKLLVALLFLAPLVAQPFQIVPSTAPSGSSGTLLTTLKSPAGSEPVALQWKISFGAGVKVSDIVAGDATTGAGKELHCAKPQKVVDETYSCLIAGGKLPLPNGTIFVVHYTIQKGLPPQTVPVKLADAVAVLVRNGGTLKVDLDPADGTITVQ